MLFHKFGRKKLTLANYQAIHREADVCLDNKTVNFTSDRSATERGIHINDNKKENDSFQSKDPTDVDLSLHFLPPTALQIQK